MQFFEKVTNRGFACVCFKDRYDCDCTIQQSSLATEDAIWFGITDPDPKIMASKTPQGGTGWVPYAIPDDVLITTRMHLSRKQVAELLPVLQHFVDTGEVAVPQASIINELIKGMTDTLGMAKATLIRFEIDLDITNHALLGKICSFVEFASKYEIVKKEEVLNRALGLLKEVLEFLSSLGDRATDDDLFTDTDYYVTEAEAFLEKNKE